MKYDVYIETNVRIQVVLIYTPLALVIISPFTDPLSAAYTFHNIRVPIQTVRRVYMVPAQVSP